MKQKTTQLIIYLMTLASPTLFAQATSVDEPHFYNDVERYVYSPEHDNKISKEYYRSLKDLSELESSKAFFYKGILEKDGIGTKENHKKALKSFKKSFELGNLQAAYSVGYFYLKGIGNVRQDYSKAYKWFERSESPMGRHWMAKMDFLGLGRTPNKEKALKLLASNELYNSQVLLEQYQDTDSLQTKSEKFPSLFEECPIEQLYGLGQENSVPTSEVLRGNWEGDYLELEWSAKKLFRSLPIEISFDPADDNFQSMEAQVKIGDSISMDKGNYNAGTVTFPGLRIPIKKQFTDYPNFTHLMTEIKKMDFRLIQHQGENLLVAKVRARYPVWKESAGPILLVLRKKLEIPEDALSSFAEQHSDFIRIYPNPAPEYCLVNFDLETASKVKLEIFNHYNTPFYNETLFDGNKGTGNHTIEVLDLPHAKGSYVLSLTYGGKVKTKILIKQ